MARHQVIVKQIVSEGGNSIFNVDSDSGHIGVSGYDDPKMPTYLLLKGRHFTLVQFDSEADMDEFFTANADAKWSPRIVKLVDV